MKSLGFLLVLICINGPLCAKDLPGSIPGKAQNNRPPAETPSGAKPAEPANPGQNAAKPAEPGNAGKPETPAEPSKPADSLKNGNPPDETPSGTKPAEPASPGENPAEPAEPGNKEKPDEVKDKPGKSGKSGGGPGGPALPSGVPTPQSGGASLLPAAGGIGGGIIGGILHGGKKEAVKEGKKEAPKPAIKTAVVVAELALPTKAAVSSETVKSTTSVHASTPTGATGPLFSEGKGPKIAVMDLDGEYGAEFSELIAEALKTDLKVYSRKELARKNYSAKAAGMSLAKKVAAATAVDYVVTGKVNKKTETLSIISVFLRTGKTGEIKMTDYPRLKSAEDLKSAAETTARKIKERAGELE